MQAVPIVSAITLSGSSLAWSTLLPLLLLVGVAVTLGAPTAVLLLLMTTATVLFGVPVALFLIIVLSLLMIALRLWRLRLRNFRRTLLAGLTAGIGMLMAAGYLFTPPGA